MRYIASNSYDTWLSVTCMSHVFMADADSQAWMGADPFPAFTSFSSEDQCEGLVPNMRIWSTL